MVNGPIKNVTLCALIATLSACGGGGGNPAPTPTPTPIASPSPSPTPVQSPNLAQLRLLSDEEMRTPALSPEPVASAASVEWVKSNSIPIRSVIYDEDFSDLAFLQGKIGNRSIVQLGESSHGTREFNQVKTRLIKYLHQEMDFDIVAFESGFFDGFYVDENRAALSAEEMRRFIFSVWSTDEVFELFRYAKETENSSRPLRFTGFDTQISSAYFSQIFPFITALPETGPLTANRKSSLTQNLTQYRSMQSDFVQLSCFSGSSAGCDTTIANGKTIRSALAADRAAIETLADAQARDMRALYIAVSAAIAQIDNSISLYETSDVGNVRDQGMAQIFSEVKNRLFPNSKIIIWAHNRHIALEQSETRTVEAIRIYPEVPMGNHLFAEFPDDLFTIGLYMLRGETATGPDSPAPVLAPRNNSLEAIAYSARLAAFYLDTSSDQARNEGNAFLFERLEAHYWGGSFGTYSMIPSDQFDGIIVIDRSSVPSYR